MPGIVAYRFNSSGR